MNFSLSRSDSVGQIRSCNGALVHSRGDPFPFCYDSPPELLQIDSLFHVLSSIQIMLFRVRSGELVSVCGIPDQTKMCELVDSIVISHQVSFEQLGRKVCLVTLI